MSAETLPIWLRQIQDDPWPAEVLLHVHQRPNWEFRWTILDAHDGYPLLVDAPWLRASNWLMRRGYRHHKTERGKWVRHA